MSDAIFDGSPVTVAVNASDGMPAALMPPSRPSWLMLRPRTPNASYHVDPDVESPMDTDWATKLTCTTSCTGRSDACDPGMAGKCSMPVAARSIELLAVSPKDRPVKRSTVAV